MTDDELQREILMIQVQALIQAYEERFGSNPYVNLDLKTVPIMQLASIRRNLHEVLYAPPSRNR